MEALCLEALLLAFERFELLGNVGVDKVGDVLAIFNFRDGFLVPSAFSSRYTSAKDK